VIVLLTGENDFELTKKVAQLKADFGPGAERYDGSQLSGDQLANLFAGQTLFSLSRLVIIDGPSANAELWQNLLTWAARLADDTRLILVEPKPDKRTSSYKWLQKNADVQVFEPYGDRDRARLTAWATEYATQQHVDMTERQVARLIERTGNDQWALAHAIDKLSLLEDVTDQWIDDVVDASSSESVFALFETALNGDNDRLREMFERLRQTEEPYRVFGLVSSQVVQLATLVHGQANSEKVARDMGARSSYPLQKLAPYAARLNKAQVRDMVASFAAADRRLKSSDADPWLVLEGTLAVVASLVKS
jgi:DNA polymerase III delta subunit